MFPSQNITHKTIWTIGHSTRMLSDFIKLLHAFNIRLLADIRSYPGSRRFPYFNKLSLNDSLTKESIDYIHLPELGGRRKPNPDSRNTAWRHEAFRGYADYMETDAFTNGMERLEILASKYPIAYMCSEAVWWKCHRALVSDYLKSRGWTVFHIMDINNFKEHPYTKAAHVAQGQLFYDNKENQ